MSLGLSKPLLDALAAKDYSQATPIQLQAIPTVLTGRDLLGIAQTGTGKTAAFMLPSLDRLARCATIPRPGQIRMLVLAPTRELAAQIAESAAGLWQVHAPFGRGGLRRRSQSTRASARSRAASMFSSRPRAACST